MGDRDNSDGIGSGTITIMSGSVHHRLESSSLDHYIGVLSEFFMLNFAPKGLMKKSVLRWVECDGSIYLSSIYSGTGHLSDIIRVHREFVGMAKARGYDNAITYSIDSPFRRKKDKSALMAYLGWKEIYNMEGIDQGTPYMMKF